MPGNRSARIVTKQAQALAALRKTTNIQESNALIANAEKSSKITINPGGYEPAQRASRVIG